MNYTGLNEKTLEQTRKRANLTRSAIRKEAQGRRRFNEALSSSGPWSEENKPYQLPKVNACYLCRGLGHTVFPVLVKNAPRFLFKCSRCGLESEKKAGKLAAVTAWNTFNTAN